MGGGPPPFGGWAEEAGHPLWNKNVRACVNRNPWLSVAISLVYFVTATAWLSSWLFCGYSWLFPSRGYFFRRAWLFPWLFSTHSWLFFVFVAIFVYRGYFCKRGYFEGVAIFQKLLKTH